MRKKIKDKRAFTLAEILGVIVILGTLIILVAPAIIKQINLKKDNSKDALYKLIYIASSQYIKENQREYPTGKSHCLKMQDLINAGKLSSPIIRVDTGENLDNYCVLAYLYSSGDEYYKIMSESEIDECEHTASLPMIDFIVTPSLNTWSQSKSIKIIYPTGDGLKI